MKVIWREDAAAYRGEFVHFDPLWAWPKPVQKPHPPIYLGGHGPKALRRVVRYCDGWLPIPIRAGALLDEIKELRELAAAAGRDPQSIAISLYGVPSAPDTLATYAAAGVQRSIFSLPSAERETILPLLDRYAGVAQTMRAR
jgi:alkanesulfonate monooxygenase SsuD/methylene tetrahydromethanopterin reductase-like flavin-dependent oxidoreductase (luciferase family)